MLIHTLSILILGIGFSLYGFYIKKKLCFLIQNSFNLSDKIISNEAIQLYANKMSKITRGFGVFFIAFSLIQYFVDNLEFSLVTIFVSLFLYLFCSFYCQKSLTGKIPTAFLVLFTILFIIIILLFGAAYIESDISIDNENVKISGIYSEKIPITELCDVFLVDTLPSIGYKTNGFSTGRINKGYFYSKSLDKNVKLLLHSESKPFIYIIYANNKYVIINFWKQETTLQVYDKLKRLVQNKTHIIKTDCSINELFKGEGKVKDISSRVKDIGAKVKDNPQKVKDIPGVIGGILHIYNTLKM